MRIRDLLSKEWATLCYNGFWYAPEMEMVMSAVEHSQKCVTGGVELKFTRATLASLDVSRHVPSTVLTSPRWISMTAERASTTTPGRPRLHPHQRRAPQGQQDQGAAGCCF